ncbi:MAG TPA: hypothetical protein VG298_13200 [Acidimicrobiales bacterium]|nr:hypothetical protein [Acidimicrobiales bacterium]
MIWLTWKQFRVQAAVVGGLLLAIAIVVIVTGLHVHDLYRSCKAVSDCGSSQFTNTDQKLQVVLVVVLTIAPALIGAFWGAPLIARELETGTYRLGWTQSVTRRRWLAVKLGVVGLASVATVGLMSLMVTWWFSPIDTVNAERLTATFDVRDIVPLGYAAFAFALGVTLGILIRKTVPSMAATLAAFAAVRLVVHEWVRPHLLPSSHALVAISRTNQSFGIIKTSSGAEFSVGAPTIPNAWVYSSSLVDKTGHESQVTFVNKACSDILNSLPSGPPGGPGPHKAIGAAGPGPTAFQSCFDKVASHFNQSVTYQPASHFWPLQGIETALFLILALLLTGLCIWWVRHRLS